MNQDESIEFIVETLRRARDLHGSDGLGERELIAIALATNGMLRELKGYEGFARLADTRLRERLIDLDRGDE